MELSEIVGVDAIRAQLKVSSKKRLLQDLADIAESVYGISSQLAYRALMDRESLGPTGVGRGVGIPHARIPGISKVNGVFVRLEKAVDFESVDKQPVDLVFALFAPENAGAEHLKALARVSRTLRSESVCAKLRSTHDVSAIFAILTAAEAERAA